MSDDKKAAETPPDPTLWWRHRRYQSYLGIAGLFGIAALAVIFPVSEAAAGLLEYTGVGCVLLIVGYGPGSTLCDAIRAWRQS